MKYIVLAACLTGCATQPRELDDAQMDYTATDARVYVMLTANDAAATTIEVDAATLEIADGAPDADLPDTTMPDTDVPDAARDHCASMEHATWLRDDTCGWSHVTAVYCVGEPEAIAACASIWETWACDTPEMPAQCADVTLEFVQ